MKKLRAKDFKSQYLPSYHSSISNLQVERFDNVCQFALLVKLFVKYEYLENWRKKFVLSRTLLFPLNNTI